jgi:hypothetical protein
MSRRCPVEHEAPMPQEQRDWLLVATNPDPERDRKIADEVLSLRLLAGRHRDGNGRPVTRYLKHNSREEREARAALARCVRDHMRSFTGELLALAIDPHTSSRYIGMTATRRVRFESPARGKPAEWQRNLIIAEFIRKQLSRYSGNVEAANAAAMTEFGISRSTAQTIWKWREQAIKDASR